MGDSPCWMHLFNDLEMTDTLSKDLAEYLADNQMRSHEELFEFLRIPSVSARSEHRGDMQRAADWLAKSMRDAGLEAEIMPTGGHPVVLGEWRGAGAGAKTVLVYGHYDAKPEGFRPGGASLHNCMSGHGPDAETWERASEAELTPVYLKDTLAFMFETGLAVRPTKFALESKIRQHEYFECWQGLKNNFRAARR